MTQEEIRLALINAGIKNLNEFGYLSVTQENILTDDVYSQFFKSMLNENKGRIKDIDVVISKLLLEIK